MPQRITRAGEAASLTLMETARRPSARGSLHLSDGTLLPSPRLCLHRAPTLDITEPWPAVRWRSEPAHWKYAPNAMVYRLRGGESALYVGRCEFMLRRVHGGFKISYRRAELGNEPLPRHGAVIIVS